MRVVVDEVFPVVAGGRYPAKAVVGEHVPVDAVVWREGHDAVAATVVWRGPDDPEPRRTRMAPRDAGLDTWTAVIVPDAEGEWTFHVEGWGDPWATWRHAVTAKVAAGQGADDLANDLETGAGLLARAAEQAPAAVSPTLLSAAADLRAADRPVAVRLAAALGEEVAAVLRDHPVRQLVTAGDTRRLWVDRQRARFGAWYELFPRSTGGVDAAGRPLHGTFATTAEALRRIADMGFDVVYLPPIHPIGTVNRKGPDNTLGAGPDDVGSPWAIGSAAGGHDAVHPDLGTTADFDALVARAAELGLEVALDLALQCAPDHPWVREHPEWFTTRPDGTIAYAENPPKRYQDIYPLNFDNDPAGLYAEVLRVVLHWVEHGVRIFRVDNPHTKPPDFWAWLIRTVKDAHPDVLFLSEAFTRPARLYGLAGLGFTQYYTYFTWRTTKQELTEFGESLVEHAHVATPNLFPTTPDILPAHLHHAPPAVFAQRAALAATLSPSWGVYSGFELFENQPLREGSEEFLSSEKYELRSRDFGRAVAGGRSLEAWLRRLNEIRRAHPALTRLDTLWFHAVDNDALIAYSKTDPATGDAVLCVVTLDPERPQEGTLWLDLPALGFSWDQRVEAEDLVTGQVWRWGQAVYLRVDPAQDVAHVAHVRPDPDAAE
ncbi:alpha-1,4-glucan--maltose-1-phosphate maltosyltransferase [Actinosynnema sp. CS-041913]|uniref:alpha-1,4-glucan--maltose-1-phosphate maltosyltransferase n=1 Tax=Actinosynnema sp. CS-041913 TaxID=3239917 RepID=UPI003D8C9940